jgi:hypothetical protein
MSQFPAPLVPGPTRPSTGLAGIQLNALTLNPVSVFPATPDLGQIVLYTDGVTYQWNGSLWNPIGTPASGGFLTKAQADLYYRGRASYPWTQGVAASVWTIPHNLGSMPAVHVIDSGGTTVEGDVQYQDLNNLTVTFSYPFSGTAYLT